MDDALRKAGLFQGVDVNDVEAISNEFEVMEVSRGQVLFHEGEPGDSLYIVLSGKVKRAPRWMLDLGLEWLYRFASQPTRYKRMLALPDFSFGSAMV